MALEYSIRQLSEEYKKTKDKRYKAAADVLRGVKNMIGHDIPLPTEDSTEAPVVQGQPSGRVELFTFKKPENALATQDMQAVSDREANRLALQSELNLRTDFYNTEFNLEVPQEEPKKGPLFSRFRRKENKRGDDLKIKEWKLYEKPEDRGDTLSMTYAFLLRSSQNEQTGKMEPSIADITLLSQYDSYSDAPHIKLFFEDRKIQGIRLEWIHSAQQRLLTLIDGDRKESALGNLIRSVADKQNQLKEEYDKAIEGTGIYGGKDMSPQSMRIEFLLPDRLDIKYSNKDLDFKKSSFLYHATDNVFTHLKTKEGRTQIDSELGGMLVEDSKHAKSIYKENIDPSEYVEVVSGILGLIPAITSENIAQ